MKRFAQGAADGGCVSRRSCLKSSLIGSVAVLRFASHDARVVFGADGQWDNVGFDISRHTPTRMYDGTQCWCHPRAGIVPGVGKEGVPRVVLTMNTLDVAGSDVFRQMFVMTTDDLGATWTNPAPSENLAVRHELIGGEKRPVAVSDFWPAWHEKSQTLLGIGHTVVYTPQWRVESPRPRHTAYAAYHPEQNAWAPWQKLAMPEGDEFSDCGAGCVQRYDLDDGDVLLPLYYRPPGKNSRVAVARCSFDGQHLEYLDHGKELARDDETRGLHEPSLARFQGQFYLTIRNDKQGFVTRSTDGLNFEPIQRWTFDDGSDLGSYNTQQHWVSHSDALLLVYTRRGADNDHVFRHRAPLFIAQVDPERLCVLRETERILVPERGARLGNFGVTTVSRHETWVTVAELMQTWGPNYILPVDNEYGADGSVYVARMRWEAPNRDR